MRQLLLELSQRSFIERLLPSHALQPEAVLAICKDAYGQTPEALLVGVRGYSFEFAEGLTEKAGVNKSLALRYIRLLIDQWRGKNMAGETGKTILIIDDDPDIRMAIRIVLESAGFVVGAASSGEEAIQVGAMALRFLVDCC